MRSIVLAFVRTFGRFGVLLLLAASLIAVAFWLDLLDDHFAWFVALAPPVIGSAIATGVLTVGMLFAASRFPKHRYVSREEAPGLWRLLDEAATGHALKRWHLAISDDFNATVRRHRTMLRPFAPEAIVTFGLPYLLTLDERAVLAVLAHEVEHDRRQHTTGSLNIAEFEQTFVTLFEHLPPERTLTGAAVYAVLGRVGQWLAQEELALSRRNEFEADSALAGAAGRREMARALTLTDVVAEFYVQEIVGPLRIELLGAMAVPRSPLLRLLEARAALREPGLLARYVALAYAKPDDPSSTHPSLAQRLASLGEVGLPAIEPVDVIAADVLLLPELQSALIAKFDRDWTNAMANSIERT